MSDDNRSKILGLAVAMIDAGGEAALRVNDVVAAAGVKPPVLYYHFGSRDGLVIAAQIERFTREHKAQLVSIRAIVERCTSREELRAAFVAIWTTTFATNIETRWRRMSVLGSSYARPELAAAIADAQNEVIDGMYEFLEPCQKEGWLREGLDLRAALIWQYGILSSRSFIEYGVEPVDSTEWDRLTLEAFERAFFGS